MMKSKRLLSFSVLTLALSFAAASLQAGEYYRWVGEDGVTHYGAKPPKGVEAELISTYGDSSPPKAKQEAASDASAATSADSNATAAKAQAQRDADCKQEKSRLQTLKSSGGRIRMQQPDGTARYLTAEEVAQEISSSELFIEKACK